MSRALELQEEAFSVIEEHVPKLIGELRELSEIYLKQTPPIVVRRPSKLEGRENMMFELQTKFPKAISHKTADILTNLRKPLEWVVSAVADVSERTQGLNVTFISGESLEQLDQRIKDKKIANWSPELVRMFRAIRVAKKPDLLYELSNVDLRERHRRLGGLSLSASRMEECWPSTHLLEIFEKWSGEGPPILFYDHGPIFNMPEDGLLLYSLPIGAPEVAEFAYDFHPTIPGFNYPFCYWNSVEILEQMRQQVWHFVVGGIMVVDWIERGRPPWGTTLPSPEFLHLLTFRGSYLFEDKAWDWGKGFPGYPEFVPPLSR
ncbi:hypothetical protein NKJ87_20090 [Mesorhizobium sp. M0027]|uniref:hypothetical protein n=1 Tax=Mesorhizobium sp. M0027 TaxID=2956848 RepID=UPI003337EFC1